MRNLETEKPAQKYAVLARQYSSACQAPCAVLDAGNIETCKIKCPLWGTKGQCGSCAESLVFNLRQSLRFGGSSVFFCQGSLMFWVSPLAAGSDVGLGLIAGPTLVLPPQELDETIRAKMGKKLHSIPRKKPENISSLAEMLRMVADWASEYQYRLSDSYRSLEFQGKLFDILEDSKDSASNVGVYYFKKIEQELWDAIIRKDLETAQAAAAKEIWLFALYNPNNHKALQIRLHEMVVLFSRAAVAGMADGPKVWDLTKKLYASLVFKMPLESAISWVKQALASYIELVSATRNESLTLGVEKAVRFAESNYKRSVSLNEAAEYVGLNTNYLSALFKKETGVSWVNFVNNIRIDKAKKLLETSRLRIGDVGDATGFSNPSTFSKVFKKITGLSPLEYRKRHISKASALP